MTKKNTRVPSYQTTNKTDEKTQSCVETYHKLAESNLPEDQELIQNLKLNMDIMIDVVPKLGILSGIELLGKLGKWLCDNNISPEAIRAYYDKPD